MRISRSVFNGCLFLGVAALVIGPPAYLISDAISPQVSSTGQWQEFTEGGVSSTSVPVNTSALADDQPVRLIVPYLVVTSPHSLSATQVARISALRGVRAALAVDGGQVTINGRSANVLGVPASFRSWTPPDTASATGIWSALSAGGMVVDYSAATRLGLTLGGSYLVGGGYSATVPFTAIAPSGLPGIDAMVDSQRSASLGLAPNAAVLISAPGAAYGPLVQELEAIAGPSAQVEDLVPVQQSSSSSSSSTPAAASPLPLAAATPGLPTNWIQLYQDSAAEYCPGMSWTVLAAIGQIESGDGSNDGPSSAGAEGPMQFIPSTWAEWGITGFGQSGTPDVMNPLDAVPSAARMLCADGAAQGGAGLSNAIWDYNHADWYVSEVLELAEEYAHDYS
jgi:hypothetical protein